MALIKKSTKICLDEFANVIFSDFFCSTRNQIKNLGLAYVITHGQDEEEEAAAEE